MKTIKISEMIKNLEEFKKKHGDLECWYARDDEGNGYKRIFYEPSLYYVGSHCEVYHSKEDLEYCDVKMKDVTPICIIN